MGDELSSQSDHTKEEIVFEADAIRSGESSDSVGGDVPDKKSLATFNTDIRRGKIGWTDGAKDSGFVTRTYQRDNEVIA